MCGNEFTFSNDWRALDIQSLHQVYASVDFGFSDDADLPPEMLEKLFPPGTYGFFAYHGELLIGAARVLSDDILDSWISEICVHPNWQRQGIGTKLLEMINLRFPHTYLFAEPFHEQKLYFGNCGLRPRRKLFACGRRPLTGASNSSACHGELPAHGTPRELHYTNQ